MGTAVKSRVILLALLLAASQCVFAWHIPAHTSVAPSNCDLCVCQAQTTAAPLPASGVPAVDRVTPLFVERFANTFAVKAYYPTAQSRAPPLPV